jgi:hypothetical protein
MKLHTASQAAVLGNRGAGEGMDTQKLTRGQIGRKDLLDIFVATGWSVCNEPT